MFHHRNSAVHKKSIKFRLGVGVLIGAHIFRKFSVFITTNSLASQDVEAGVGRELVNDEGQEPDPVKRVLVAQKFYESCTMQKVITIGYNNYYCHTLDVPYDVDYDSNDGNCRQEQAISSGVQSIGPRQGTQGEVKT